MPTISALLVEADPTVKQLGEDPTMFELEPPTTMPSASETIDLPADICKEDSQLAPPHKTIKPVVPLAK